MKFPIQIHSFPTHQIIVGASHFDDPVKAADFAMKEKFAAALGMVAANESYWQAAVERVMEAARSNPQGIMDLLMEYHERITSYKVALETAKLKDVPGNAPKFPSAYNKDGPRAK